MKKILSDLSETLHTFSLGKINLPLFEKKMGIKILNEKKSNFKFQKSGNFGSNSLWEIGEVQIPYGKSASFFLVLEKNVPQIS